MLKSNTINKIIAVAVAVTLWAYVIISENPSQTVDIKEVPVQFTNMDVLNGRDLTIASDAAYTVDLKVEGKRADVGKLQTEDFTAAVNLLGWQEGEQIIPVEVKVPGVATLLSTRPARITVNIEKRVRVSKPIHIEFTEPFPKGREPGFITMIPDEIEVMGAQSQIENISYVRVLVDSPEVGDEIGSFVIAARPMDLDGEPIFAPLQLSQTDVEIRAMLCYVREVPLYVDVIGEIDPMLEITSRTIPRTVEIRGSKSAVDAVDALYAAAVDISGVDVTSRIPIAISLPDDVELADASANISIAINIKGIATKEFVFTSDEIRVEGSPEGYAGHINSSGVTVSVYGTDAVISGFDREDILPFVDLSVLAPGEEAANLPIQLRYEKELRKTEAAPDSVYVNLIEIPSSGVETEMPGEETVSGAGVTE
ncbi:MAG: hypothetical protein LBT26_08760 [Clostridiales Family XIII bacterium]|jgi:YbbR domain-containing protein|nr:hypothetical protein [Clostridiales Family XIII bacterium]